MIDKDGFETLKKLMTLNSPRENEWQFAMISFLWWFTTILGLKKKCNIYRPRSEGDNALGSVRPSVCPSVRLSVCLRSHG